MAEHHIDERICKGCALCSHYCPKGVLEMSAKRNKKGYTVNEAAHPEKCIVCKMCEINCPDFVIHVEKKEATEKQK